MSRWMLCGLLVLSACAAPGELDEPWPNDESDEASASADAPSPIDDEDPPLAGEGLEPEPDELPLEDDLPPESEPPAPEPDPDPEPEPPEDAPEDRPEGRPTYRAGQAHSPITPFVAEHLRSIAAQVPRQGDVFAKIGDSITVSRGFLHCFGGPDEAIALDGRAHLRATLEHFGRGDAAGSDPFTRVSQAATVGWSVAHALRGEPTPVDREIAAIDPRFAVVMYGTNDIEGREPDTFGEQLLRLIDGLIADGIIPILSTIPPRDDRAASDALVPTYNGIIRGIAQGRAVPLVDLHGALSPLEGHGLGRDRLHPSAHPGGACLLHPDGLTHGYNVRNLLTLEALDRVRRVVLDAGEPPDAAEPASLDDGGVTEPFSISALPFSDMRDTADSPHRRIDAYPGCDAPQDESGPEYVYRLDLDRPTVVRAWVIDQGSVDIDLHLMADPTDPASCLDRDHHTIEASLAAGTWYFVLDTYVSGGAERSGEFLFVLTES